MDPDPPFVTTTNLVARAQKGDEEAIEHLFDRYLPRVRGIVRLRLSHRPHQAADEEELVSDSLMDALKGLERFEPKSEGRFCNWPDIRPRR